VGSRITQELAVMLSQEFRDPRLEGVVITATKVADDVSQAQVGFVLMGEDPGGRRAKVAGRRLDKLASMIRSKLAPRLGLRHAPELHFSLDANRDDLVRLDALLREVGDELKAAPPAAPPVDAPSVDAPSVDAPSVDAPKPGDPG
jgi:ribosome-binding factor A